MFLAQKLREKVSKHNFNTVGSKTASFGVSMFKENMTDSSDTALYKSKENGRDMVTTIQ